MTSSGEPKPTQLYFIRHGDATYDVDGAAPSLTPLGVVPAVTLIGSYPKAWVGLQRAADQMTHS